MNASTSRCISQCATFCSMYCSVIPLKIARLGSSWKKQAEMPIFSMFGLHRRGEDVFEIVPRALPRIGLVTGVVDRHLHQSRNVGVRDSSGAIECAERRWYADIGFHLREPCDERLRRG